MSPNLVTAKQTLHLLVYSGGSFVGTAVSAVGLAEQLNQQQHFLHLSVPLWFCYLIVFMLSVFGSIASLYTDTIRDTDHSNLVNLCMGFFCGIIGAFIILPSMVAIPSVGLMFVSALGFSFSGTVLLHILEQVISSSETRDGLKQVIVSFIVDFFTIVKERVIKAVKILFGMGSD